MLVRDGMWYFSLCCVVLTSRVLCLVPIDRLDLDMLTVTASGSENVRGYASLACRCSSNAGRYGVAGSVRLSEVSFGGGRYGVASSALRSERFFGAGRSCVASSIRRYERFLPVRNATES